ncbi:MAG: hypothetical protein LBU47_02435 [Christensenellaceae bacterium]|jgi:hypothetical protein|nr:hypothetical protein [Christensenellaceae bacterium]
MQAKSGLARGLDRVLPIALFGLLCFLFYAGRLRNLLTGAALSARTAALFGYGLWLFRKSRKGKGRRALQEGRLAGEYALLHMPREKALRLIQSALGSKYGLICEKTAKNGLILGEYEGQAVALFFLQAADGPHVRDLQAFDRRRRGLPGLLLCCAQADRAALQYAAAARPPLEILRAAELPVHLPAGELPGERPGGFAKLKALWRRALSPGRAGGYMQAAAFLLALFILSDRLLYLVPGLFCALMGSLAARQGKLKPRLFAREA